MGRNEATTPLTSSTEVHDASSAATEVLFGERTAAAAQLPWADIRLPFVEVPPPAGLVLPEPEGPAPRLRPGEMLGEKYEVLGCLAHGGIGSVYLARDIELDGNHVALKGLIDTGDATLDTERRMLTALNHPNIVRIFGFVTHDDDPSDGYIVMEYVGGLSLREVIRRLAGDEHPLGEPLRAEHVIGYGQQILDALHYLHDQGLLYCDLKPDNVVHGHNRIKIVDLGATRRIGDHDSHWAITRRYQVGEDELAEFGLTVRSDLHTLGVTLTELLDVSADRDARPGDGGIGFGVQSLRHALDRAMAPFAERFISAADMAGHLDGVLREIRALRTGEPHPAPSTVFAESPALLDAGLGTVPGLERWTTTSAAAYRPPELGDGRPAPAAVAVGLPAPQVDPADPVAPFLADVRAPDARRLLGQLAGLPHESVELALARCRAYLELGDTERAAECLGVAEHLLGSDVAHDWRLTWHRGLLALGRTEVAAAEQEFATVYRALAGEAAPKLALGYCAEYLGRRPHAHEYYRAVWTRDHTQVGAAFGLARLRLAHGDRAGAVAILDDVPQVSLHFYAARIAAVRVLTGRLLSGPPSPHELAQALQRLPDLHLEGDDESGGSGETRDRLTTEVNEAALELAEGRPQTEQELRALLAESLRALARQARRPDDHGVLIDLANQVRPRTRF